MTSRTITAVGKRNAADHWGRPHQHQGRGPPQNAPRPDKEYCSIMFDTFIRRAVYVAMLAAIVFCAIVYANS